MPKGIKTNKSTKADVAALTQQQEHLKVANVTLGNQMNTNSAD